MPFQNMKHQVGSLTCRRILLSCHVYQRAGMRHAMFVSRPSSACIAVHSKTLVPRNMSSSPSLQLSLRHAGLRVLCEPPPRTTWSGRRKNARTAVFGLHRVSGADMTSEIDCANSDLSRAPGPYGLNFVRRAQQGSFEGSRTFRLSREICQGESTRDFRHKRPA